MEGFAFGTSAKFVAVEGDDSLQQSAKTPRRGMIEPTILLLKMQHPGWGPTEISDEVKRRVPGAKTSPRSVSSTLSVFVSELKSVAVTA